MKTSPARLAALAASALTLGACDITPPGSGGEDAACADDAGTATVDDQCTTIVTEFCKQLTAPTCDGMTIAFSDCLTADMPMCCTGSACDAISQSCAADVATCTTAIDAETCYELTQGLPAACQGVPQMP
jgi:hypothetical protein